MVRLVPMTEEEFRAFLERDVKGYAEQNVKAGYWSESQALEKSRQEHERLLPEGLASKDHYLLTIEEVEHGEKVGMVWLSVDRQSSVPFGFIFDLYIAEAFRRRGYARQAMLKLEEKARELGLKKLSLHVFAHDEEARALYEKLGYRVSSLNMLKELASD